MGRGELRIYIGAAPGVGKTFAMLNEGWRRKERGTDVVVAVVETHDRTTTERELRDLEVIPRRRLTYRGEAFEEMDVDAVLARAPSVALVDELAHTNVPGSRNVKRWQDIEELLAAGITVVSTVNIQHLESLTDVIEQITGVVQRETVPDSVVRSADQIELVDMTPEALRRRLAHGNVYSPENVDTALANYFRVGNLAALRELTLLWVADRVDEGLTEYRERHGIDDPWETRERVVVALTGAPGGDRLIRRGSRMASRAHAELVGVHVRSSDGLSTPDESLLARHRELLEEFGGRYAEVTGTETAEALLRFARAENATQIVLGASRRSRWTELTRGSVINRIVEKAGPIDVHVISPPDAAPAEHARSAARRRPRPRSSRARAIAWVLAVAVIPLLVIGLVPFDDSLGTSGALLLLLLAPVGVALIGGLAPSITASVIAFVLADWFYIAPTHTLRVSRAGDALALVVFLVVSCLVSGLVDVLARRNAQLARGQSEAEALATLAQGTALLDSQALHRLVAELRVTLDLDAVAVLSPVVDGWHVDAAAGEPVARTPEDASDAFELADGSVLVITGPTLPADDRRVLVAFVAQLRLAQATLKLQADAANAAALTQANDLRDALLAAVSHDLRGPLANIKAAATSLLSTDVEWTRDDTRSFAGTIDDEADRLGALVSNLLDMSRLHSGMLGVRMGAVTADEVIYSALASLAVDTNDIDVDVSDSLPHLATDAALLERVLANIIANGLSHAPEGTRVRVEAALVGDRVDIRVIDRGSGIPVDQRLQVFEPFQRLGDGGRAAHEGIGLGLAVARGLAEAIGAEISIDDTPAGGATVVISTKVVS
jgi:two-component system sensor histidine kinase KdpD